MSKNGLILLTPTSIAYTGTSASISANGSVSFSAVDPLNINGVFTADYDNYMIVLRCTNSDGAARLDFRLRASGTDDATASSYVYQALQASGTTVSGLRSTLSYTTISIPGGNESGLIVSMYGPYLTQPTAFRSVTVTSAVGASILDYATTHNQSTAYDGFSIIPHVGTFSGRIAVYGMRK